MKKNQKNMPLFWGSMALLSIVLVAVAVNYFGHVSQLSQSDAVGLQLTDGEEVYICDNDHKLIIEIVGSEKNLKDRTAHASFIPDSFNGPAQSPNMKLKEVTADESVRYAYKENSLLIDKEGKVTFYIFNKMLEQPKDIAVAKNCVKAQK